MSSSIKSKAVHGVFWSSVDRFASQGISFCFSIVLARILAPKDYGVVAMIVIFTAIAQAFVDSGFSNALIRKPDLKERDLSTAFYFNIVVGVVCYAILFAASPFIAGFYNTPILSPIIKVEALGVVFNSLCVVQRATFTKRVDFKTQAKVSIICTIVSGMVGVCLAYGGYGIWSLVVQSTLGTLVNCILLWLFSKWRPTLTFCRESFRYLWGYGSKLLASGLLDTAYNNIYPIVIGKFYSPAQLGLFSRAQSYSSLLSSNITGVLQRSTFPVLSLIQDDDERLRCNYRRLLRVSAYIIFPLMIGLAALARPLIITMITAKWEACVIYLQIICFSMMWYPIHAINLNLLQVKGRSDLFLRLEIIKKALGVSIMCVTIPMGVLAMCCGMVCSSFLCLIINTYYTGKLIHVGYFRQMRDLLPIFAAALAMGATAYAATLPFEAQAVKLIAGFLAGALTYLAISIVFKFPEFQEIKSIVLKKH